MAHLSRYRPYTAILEVKKRHIQEMEKEQGKPKGITEKSSLKKGAFGR